MLNILNVGYKIESNQQTSHLLYLDDLKIFNRNEAQFSEGLPIIRPLTDRFNNDSDDVDENTFEVQSIEKHLAWWSKKS